MPNKTIKIKPSDLPLHIEYETQEKKDYLLITGKDKKGLQVIKKEN